MLDVRLVRTARASMRFCTSDRSTFRSAAPSWQRSGWTDFDATSPPLSPKDIVRERELYGVGRR
ncbi:hypothetical protein HZZ13_24340 [Bradyrhizobium sp. CNPSo 4010]|uniref:Uncharacterized protein n=1 Tax=Bradyrhizobium agreste TaxID=2751811 RepID=A0ABS0PUK5_9BRAD|nr:hypothetical protein [Bradyrhizobium agreste]MBH5400883.1 hypothetical protein [Bradyrhizobium agreste]